MPALRFFPILLVALPVAAVLGSRHSSTAVALPPATVTMAPALQGSRDTAVFAGGCFWGIEAVFEHVRGVTDATSGYSGGAANTADYEQVSDGNTGHAESVRVIYDPSQVKYSDLLRVFFSVAHDPEELNRQGPDDGTQYRSAIFFNNAEQGRVAKAYIAQLTKAKVFKRPIVTEVTPLTAFYPAEAYHQNFAARNPTYPYIVINDRPKVDHLKTQLPDLYRESTH